MVLNINITNSIRLVATNKYMDYFTIKRYQMTIRKHTNNLLRYLKLFKNSDILFNPRNRPSCDWKHMHQIGIHHDLQVVQHEYNHNWVYSSEYHHEPIFHDQVHLIFAHRLPVLGSDLIVYQAVWVLFHNFLFTMATIQFYLIVY